MASQYRDEFIKAAQKEIDDLTSKGAWIEDLKSNATVKIVPSQWVLKIKRTSDGSFLKAKGRVVVRGDLQEDTGEDYYSPVAAWPTVRTFLILSIMLGWITVSIDFNNAFIQSYLPKESPVWIHIPRGYKSSKGNEYCLRLIKSVYGIKSAPALWFKHSGDAFKKMGLKQSQFDECLWYGKDIMVVQYVDDCGISAPNQGVIDL